jgi:hypothetical protein
MRTHLDSWSARTAALRIALAVCAAGALLTGCGDIDSPNFNNPSISGALENPSRSNIANAAQGLLRGTRLNVGESVRWLGAFGREGYPMAASGASLPGSVRDPLISDGFPGNVLYADPYRNILGANLLLEMVDKTTVLTAAEQSAVRGYAHTITAYDLLQVIIARDKFGAPVDVSTDPNAPPAPILTKAEVYTRIARLLDEGATELAAGGATFPFTLTAGLAPFDRPATFGRLNRALKARVSVYRDDWTGALQALSGSFLSTSQPLAFGAYHNYSTTSGDIPNPNFRPDLLWANRRLRTEAQRRADGSLDLRVQQKLVTVPVFTLLGISSDVQFTMYNAPNAPIPWIKNEELILLRAEANLGLGNRAAALTDINYIRVNSGGLEPLPTTFSGDLLTELLYNKHYSLLWEGGHTWIDMRHYGRLLSIPVGTADPRLYDAMPIPGGECQARDPKPAGCDVVVGFLPPPTR